MLASRSWLVGASLAIAGCRIGFDATPIHDDAADDGSTDGSTGDGASLPNLVFMTSIEYDIPTLGSVAAADQACAARALAAGLPGTFIAWVSTSSAAAGGRLSGARGWIRRDGELVADQAADLLAGKLFHPIRVDENGSDPGRVTVFTGTTANGTVTLNCGDLTNSATNGAYGVSVATTSWWTNGGGLSCTTPMRLYCLEASRNVPVAIVAASGRLAFVTSTGFTPGGGLAAADLLCHNEALGAGLNGTFLALLATSTASAASRFVTNGSAWVRPDGVATAATAAALLSGMPEAPPNVTVSGIYVSSTTWGGASSVETAGTTTTTCQNWTSASSSVSALTGWSSMANGDFFASILFGSGQPRTATCNSSLPIYCLEQ